VCNTLQEIFITFILNGLLSLIIAKYLDNKIQNNKDKHEKELAIINAELTRIQMIAATKFSELHQTRAKVISDFYKKLVIAKKLIDLYKGAYPVPKISNRTDDKEDKLKPLDQAIDNLVEFYEESKIFFSEEQVSNIDQLIELLQTLNLSLYLYDISNGKKTFTELVGSIEERLNEHRDKYNELFPKIMSLLEKDFRNTLGFELYS
jgi:hypothetical protein